MLAAADALTFVQHHGKRAPAWNRNREVYFAWHRANRFRARNHDPDPRR